MLASIGTADSRSRVRPQKNAEARISGIRSSTVGKSSNGCAEEMITPGSNCPATMSDTRASSHSRTTRSKNRRQSIGNARACGPPITVRTPAAP